MSKHRTHDKQRHDRQHHDLQQVRMPLSTARLADVQRSPPGTLVVPSLRDRSPEDEMLPSPRVPYLAVAEEDSAPSHSPKTLRSSNSRSPLRNNANQPVRMHGATKTVETEVQRNARLAQLLEHRLGKQGLAAKQEANAAKAEADDWKAKYEAKVVEIAGLEQRNWELEDEVQDALEQIEILRDRLMNSIPARLQGESMDYDPLQVEPPLKRYETEQRSGLRERAPAHKPERD